jgi:hypothetical protein
VVVALDVERREAEEEVEHLVGVHRKVEADPPRVDVPPAGEEG